MLNLEAVQFINAMCNGSNWRSNPQWRTLDHWIGKFRFHVPMWLSLQLFINLLKLGVHCSNLILASKNVPSCICNDISTVNRMTQNISLIMLCCRANVILKNSTPQLNCMHFSEHFAIWCHFGNQVIVVMLIVAVKICNGAKSRDKNFRCILSRPDKPLVLNKENIDGPSQLGKKLSPLMRSKH